MGSPDKELLGNGHDSSTKVGGATGDPSFCFEQHPGCIGLWAGMPPNKNLTFGNNSDHRLDI